MPIDVNCSAWKGFRTGEWRHLVNVRNFIQKNYTPYAGDESFLAPTSERTQKVWDKSHALILEELRKGILDVETDAISGINNFAPGYIDRDNEVIVGLQTDAPLKRIVNLYGGMRMAESALEQYGYKLNPEIERHFRTYRKTHNDGVFDAYPHRTRVARTVGLLTGLPDAYGRGRIVGDYRRVPLYGADFLIEEKKKDLDALDGAMTDERIRLREEVQMQIRALQEMALMAKGYGCDITKPAETAHDAVQSLYMAYLAGVKENNGAATSLGRTATFLDIYIQRDLDNGTLAGSTLNINKGLRILVEEAMVPFNYALNACTINPARCLHLDDRKGSIQIGKDADLVVLDDNYDVLQTYCMGKAQL